MPSHIDACSRCGKDRNITGFVKKRKICKKCANEESRLYKLKNKEKISAYNKKYKMEHQEEIKEYNVKYNIENREKIQERHTPYLKNKRKTDPQYKVSVSLRNRINKVLNGQKKKKTLELLGCSYDFLKEWLEYQFKKDMTFDNHGKVWHIDHIIPCKCFDLTDDSERIKCFNWSNLQPLHSKENMSKKATIRPDEIAQNKKNIRKFLKTQNNEDIPELIEFDRDDYI
mgnify:CR=1 FL=1